MAKAAIVVRKEKKRHTIDFHCDLLAYLAVDRSLRTPLQPASNCSLTQLQIGGVALQVLPIFTETGSESTKIAQKQIDCLEDMLNQYASWVVPFTSTDCLIKEQISILLAIENASSLLLEEEPLKQLFTRLDSLVNNHVPILYVSLTWNEENRFGGGNRSCIGLKRDGEILLEYLAEKGIAVDLSHASDWLASQIIETIDKKKLSLIPIASHSNFRQITPCERNLPEAVAKEIIARKGVIGINFFRHFSGGLLGDLLKHVLYGIEIGGEHSLVLGADFFGGLSNLTSLYSEPFFYPSLSNSGEYPFFFELLREELSEERINQIAYDNGYQFIANRSFSLLPQIGK